MSKQSQSIRIQMDAQEGDHQQQRGAGRAETREQAHGKQQQEASQVREHRKKGGEERGQGNSVKQHPERQRWAEWSSQAEHSSGNHVAKLDGLNEDSLKHGASKTGTLKISVLNGRQKICGKDQILETACTGSSPPYIFKTSRDQEFKDGSFPLFLLPQEPKGIHLFYLLRVPVEHYTHWFGRPIFWTEPEKEEEKQLVGLFDDNSVCIGEGNGTPLQYSCLENPMDRGARVFLHYKGQEFTQGASGYTLSTRSPRKRQDGDGEVKSLSANVGDTEGMSSNPTSRRFPEGGNGNPLQYSCLENPMDRRAWQPTVHEVTKRWTRLNTPAFLVTIVTNNGSELQRDGRAARGKARDPKNIHTNNEFFYQRHEEESDDLVEIRWASQVAQR
ncbi:hypothetical protein MG293_001789 [Ovis ammon polii]|uniref:Uncharacterized protein n=1 Tax=Ovis ammon polii TaxID=230172 RepID=A0AAD4YIC7_OVIAM|nr:hypothetical protein MG293_001789 [Ovis ammon polii]